MTKFALLAFFVIAYMITLFSKIGCCASPHLLPELLKDLENEEPCEYYYKIRDIPQPVMDGFVKAMRGEELKIADRGAAWNKTDVTFDPSLPFRRLIWAVKIRKFYVIHYEMGGDSYSTHFLIAAPNGVEDRWVVTWSAVGSNAAKDYSAFIMDLTHGKLDTDPKLWH